MGIRRFEIKNILSFHFRLTFFEESDSLLVEAKKMIP